MPAIPSPLSTAAASSGFLYATSTMGVTGVRGTVDSAAAAIVARLDTLRETWPPDAAEQYAALQRAAADGPPQPAPRRARALSLDSADPGASLDQFLHEAGNAGVDLAELPAFQVRRDEVDTDVGAVRSGLAALRRVASSRAIEPPPAPMVMMSTIGSPIGHSPMRPLVVRPGSPPRWRRCAKPSAIGVSSRTIVSRCAGRRWWRRAGTCPALLCSLAANRSAAA